MIIFDAHLDLAWNAIDWNRDLRMTCEQIRQVEKDAGMTDKGRCCNSSSRTLPRAIIKPNGSSLPDIFITAFSRMGATSSVEFGKSSCGMCIASRSLLVICPIRTC